MWTVVILISLLGASAPTGQLAFVSEDDPETARLYLYDFSTRIAQPVGPGRRDGPAAWAPDGSWLACDVRRDDGPGSTLCVIKADGSERQLLKLEARDNRDPAWSQPPREETQVYHPRLAYSSSNGRSGRAQIRVFDLETGKEAVWGGSQAPPLMRPAWLSEASPLAAALRTQLEDMSEKEAAAWSQVKPNPANTLLAIGIVTHGRQASTDVFVVTPDHALPLPEVSLPSRGTYAEWSVAPDPTRGGEIAFESNDGGDREIFILTTKGTFDVTNHRAADWNPVWSPDSRWIAFESFRGGRRGVYRVNPDGALVFPVVAMAESDCWNPSWSPDGEWLAYVSNVSGRCAVHVCDVHGQKQALVGGTVTTSAYAPAWRPEAGS